ncbi:MAG: DUF4365 domain-containing protein [Gemmataceae bacterium]|nr:DUF4365 domain-containing protein [Gemmataceae bacterium]
MGRHRRPAEHRKRRTREHVIGDLAVNHAQRHVLRVGFTLEAFRHDYGLDLLMFTYAIDGVPEYGEVRFQIKGHERVPIRTRSNSVAARIERADILAWLGEPYPVILIVYDVAADCAYWLYVQAYFAALPGFSRFRLPETANLPVPAANVLDADAVRRFRVFRAQVAAQFPGEIDQHE